MSVQPAEEPLEPVYSEAEHDAIDIMWLERLAKPFTPTRYRPFRAVRCSAPVRNGERKGRQCGREATLGTTVCEVHGAQLPAVKKAADELRSQIQLRLIGMTTAATDALEDLIANSASDAVRLKAATEVLDRSGIRGGTDVNVSVDVTGADPADVLRARLAQLQRRTSELAEEDDDVLDAEEVPPAAEADDTLAYTEGPPQHDQQS